MKEDTTGAYYCFFKSAQTVARRMVGEFLKNAREDLQLWGM